MLCLIVLSFIPCSFFWCRCSVFYIFSLFSYNTLHSFVFFCIHSMYFCFICLYFTIVGFRLPFSGSCREHLRRSTVYSDASGSLASGMLLTFFAAVYILLGEGLLTLHSTLLYLGSGLAIYYQLRFD